MILLLIFSCLLVPNAAFAWAPGTHLYFAKEVLQFSWLLPSTLQALLAEFRADYLYGCIAADITLGKAFVEYIYNCHNFEVGIGLLDHARTPAERAFVYGYLSHLASDTVSHNFFVPYQNVSHFEGVSFRHAYWEVRLDQFFGDRVWHEVEAVVANPRTHTHDQLLDAALKDTVFSFRTNKLLFSSMLAIQRLKKWQSFVKSVNRLSSLQFNPQHLAEYNKLAVSAIVRLLAEGKQSCVFRVDPTGCKTMEEAKSVRQYLRGLKRSGKLTGEIHEEECARFRQHVRRLYFEEYPITEREFTPSLHLKV